MVESAAKVFSFGDVPFGHRSHIAGHFSAIENFLPSTSHSWLHKSANRWVPNSQAETFGESDKPAP
jgi:hypothetical protein